MQQSNATSFPTLADDKIVTCGKHDITCEIVQENKLFRVFRAPKIWDMTWCSTEWEALPCDEYGDCHFKCKDGGSLPIRSERHRCKDIDTMCTGPPANDAVDE